jgi:hypothetical protein
MEILVGVCAKQIEHTPIVPFPFLLHMHNRNVAMAILLFI